MHTFTYQKTLLYPLFCLFLKSSNTFSVSLKAVAWGRSISKVFLKISQKSLEETFAGVSFIIMLRAVVSVPSQEHIKDKILTHALAFL